MEGRKKEWRLIRAVLPSLAAPAVSLGVGGLDGVECLHSPARLFSKTIASYDIYCTYAIVICQAFFAIFSGHEKKVQKRGKKLLTYIRMFSTLHHDV